MNIKNEIKFAYDSLMKYSSFFGSFVFWVFAILFFLIINETKFALMFILGTIIGKAIEYVIKIVYKTQRPSVNKNANSLLEKFHDLGSFPSGHSIVASLFTTMIYLKYRMIYLALLFVVMSILTGLSRVHLKRHYPRDVVMGYIIGAIVGFLLR